MWRQHPGKAAGPGPQNSSAQPDLLDSWFLREPLSSPLKAGWLSLQARSLLSASSVPMPRWHMYQEPWQQPGLPGVRWAHVRQVAQPAGLTHCSLPCNGHFQPSVTQLLLQPGAGAPQRMACHPWRQSRRRSWESQIKQHGESTWFIYWRYEISDLVPLIRKHKLLC